MVTVDNVSMHYRAFGSTVHALENVTLKIVEGEFLSILGPSGCGKSTLLRIIAGLVRPTGGTVTLAGHKVEGPSDEVGVVFQSPVLMPWRTVIENVELPIEIKNLDRKAHHPRAAALIEMVGLSKFNNHYPHQLSGGMQQRVSLCRALICDPPVVLMDEPFGALDALTREQLNSELQRIWLESRKTVLFVTHSIPESVFLSDRVVVMSARPGVIKAIREVPFPRPRTNQIFQDPAFWTLTQQLREDLSLD